MQNLHTSCCAMPNLLTLCLIIPNLLISCLTTPNLDKSCQCQHHSYIMHLQWKTSASIVSQYENKCGKVFDLVCGKISVNMQKKLETSYITEQLLILTFPKIPKYGNILQYGYYFTWMYTWICQKLKNQLSMKLSHGSKKTEVKNWNCVGLPFETDCRYSWINTHTFI